MATFGRCTDGDGDYAGVPYDWMSGGKFTTPADMDTLTSIGVKLKKNTSGTMSARVEVYDSSFACVAESDEVTGIGDSYPSFPPGHAFSISQSLSPNTVYWFGVRTSEGWVLRRQSGGSQEQYTDTGLGDYPSIPCPTTGQYKYDYIPCICLTYTPSGAGLSIPVAMRHFRNLRTAITCFPKFKPHKVI